MNLTSRERIMRIFHNEDIDRPSMKLSATKVSNETRYMPIYEEINRLSLEKTDVYCSFGFPVDIRYGTEYKSFTEGTMVPTGDPNWVDRVSVMHTPKGDLRQVQRLSTVKEPSFILEHFIKEPEDIDKLSTAIENCDGTAESMAATMQDNLKGQLTILKSQLEELAISFGELLMPIIRKVVSKIQDFVDKLNGMSEAQKKTILKVAALAAAIGPLLVVLGTVISKVGTGMKAFAKLGKGILKVGSAVKKAGGLMGVLKKALTALTSPVGLVIAAVAALVAAFAVMCLFGWQEVERISGITQTDTYQIVMQENLDRDMDEGAHMYIQYNAEVAEVWDVTEWMQADRLTALLYGDGICMDGGVEAFLEDEEYSILVIGQSGNQELINELYELCYFRTDEGTVLIVDK